MAGTVVPPAQEPPNYWSSTPPSSPKHIIKTAPHAAIALLGAGSFSAFSYSLVQQLVFDACLAAGLAAICLHIYTLLSERCLQRSYKMAALSAISVEKTSSGKDETEGVAESDLTGCATRLGVSVREGTASKGGTMNRLMIDALAKEYLRCTAALKCYQTTFGPLPDEAGEDVPQPDADPLTSGTLEALKIPMNLEELQSAEQSHHPTPRSPAELSSPDPRRNHEAPPEIVTDDIVEEAAAAATDSADAAADQALDENTSSSSSSESCTSPLNKDAKPGSPLRLYTGFGLFGGGGGRQSI